MSQPLTSYTYYISVSPVYLLNLISQECINHLQPIHIPSQSALSIFSISSLNNESTTYTLYIFHLVSLVYLLNLISQ
jgi:hypothetical protein